MCQFGDDVEVHHTLDLGLLQISSSKYLNLKYFCMMLRLRFTLFYASLYSNCTNIFLCFLNADGICFWGMENSIHRWQWKAFLIVRWWVYYLCCSRLLLKGRQGTRTIGKCIQIRRCCLGVCWVFGRSIWIEVPIAYLKNKII